MFRFEYQDNLYWLLTIIVFVGLFIFAWQLRKRMLARFGDMNLVQQLINGYSRFNHILKFILLMLAIGMLIIAWANPQWGTKLEKVELKSADVIFALDISYSMLAEDVPPNRMERAKRFTEELVNALKGERLGLILFAGNAYLQTPLTSDYAAVSLFIKSANPYQATTQGTDIGATIELAEKFFEEDDAKSKALIIITDGENHDENAEALAAEASKNEMLIFTVGVGTELGSYIPIEMNGRKDYKKDERGETVKSTLNEAALEAIAKAANGNYFNLSEGSEAVIQSLQTEINKLEKRKLEQRNFEEYESYFQYFIALTLLLLLVEFLIPYKKSRYMEGRDLFS